MSPSAYIGRIGGLAVGLGIGAAVLMSPAMAAAGPESTVSGTGNSSDGAPSRDRLPVRSGSGGTGTAGIKVRTSRPAASAKAIAAIVRPPNGNQSARNADVIPIPASLVPGAVVAKSPVAKLAAPPQPGPVEAQQAAAPALLVNGYNAVPTSKLDAVAFYAPKSGGPAVPGLQGSQNFALVDPATGETVGSFTAHLTRDMRNRNEVLQVTEIQSGTVGTSVGDIPPVGSVISARGLGSKLTTIYSDMPSPNGYVARNVRITPSRTVNLPVKYHAAFLHTDYVAANKPLDLRNGFTIAPQAANTEVFRTITGMPPIFTAVQGTQSYGVYDHNNVMVGTFEGLVTTTSDLTGINTKMIVVTDTGDQTNVGVGPGQVPPAGTVYNVMYFFNPTSYLLYQSSPMPTGDFVSTQWVTKRSTIPLKLGNLNASSPPTLTNISVPGGSSFAPTGSAQIIGGNGLPPRNMITQGYQQFNVLDSNGTTVGSYDAFLTREWGGLRLRVQHEEILVAKVTGGSVGTGVGDVPPVGTVYDIRMIGTTGLGDIDIATPTGDGRVGSKRYLATPLGFIPVPARGRSAVSPSDVVFSDPFVSGS